MPAFSPTALPLPQLPSVPGAECSRPGEPSRRITLLCTCFDIHADPCVGIHRFQVLAMGEKYVEDGQEGRREAGSSLGNLQSWVLTETTLIAQQSILEFPSFRS